MILRVGLVNIRNCLQCFGSEKLSALTPRADNPLVTSTALDSTVLVHTQQFNGWLGLFVTVGWEVAVLRTLRNWSKLMKFGKKL